MRHSSHFVIVPAKASLGVDFQTLVEKIVVAGIQVSQEEGQVVWYSPLLKNSPQFIVIHTVNGFGIVNKAEIDVFTKLNLSNNGQA